MSEATVAGGLAPFNFTGNAGLDELTQAGFGAQSVLWNGVGPVPSASGSSNGTLVITSGGADVTLPGGYSAVYDEAGGDTLNGGDSNLKVFLQGNVSPGTDFNTGSGNDTIYAGGNDTITAGSGSNTVVGNGTNYGTTIVDGRAGLNLKFVGGTGAVSVIGGLGNSTLFGGTGSAHTFLSGGVGNNTLVGGSGTGASTIGGGHNLVAFAAGSGPTDIIAGTGNSILNGTTGAGQELLSTNPLSNAGTALIAANNSADTIIGGSGQSTVIGGAGPDMYGFLANHAGGSESILGLKAGDSIVFGNYSGNPISHEAVSGGSDQITLTDGTSITVVGFDHKLFS